MLALKANFFAKSTQISKFSGGKCAHFAGYVGNHLREKGGDECVTFGGQFNDDEAAVGSIPLSKT